MDLQLYGRDTPDWPEQLLRDILRRYDLWGTARYAARWTPPPLPDALGGSVFRDAMDARRELRARLGNEQPVVVLLDEMERVSRHGAARGAPDAAGERASRTPRRSGLAGARGAFPAVAGGQRRGTMTASSRHLGRGSSGCTVTVPSSPKKSSVALSL